LLLDSGGQYRTGTTDITRVFAFGAAGENDDLKRHYTTVLKGHLALKRARFPEGATGAQLDTLARAPIWEEGLDYPHGTGHGIGVYGHVHEDAGVAFSPRSQEALKPGMVLTNEPGYYREDRYGIRIENILSVYNTGESLDDGRALLAFEDLTLAPYARDLIMTDMLSRQEIAQIDAYHAYVYETLAPRLDDAACQWLVTATARLSS
jgi:Xaa-Pro aminopeptidase